jgi:ribosomal protein RSM22 (predicted rRNA methylase)
VPQFDLILLGLVLNELPADIPTRAAFLRSLIGSLAEDGSIIVIEPALRETARALHAVRDAIVAAGAPPNVFAPCLRAGTCPMLESERDWCHEDVHVALPGPVAEIARAAGLRYERLTYSYLTLRRDGRTLRDAVARAGEGEPWRVVSEPMPSKGKLELFVCGVPGRARLVRLDRHRTEANARLDRKGRGSLLRIPGAADDRGRLRVGADTPVED